MNRLPKAVSSRENAAALIIVLAFVVLLTGLGVAYLSRTTSDRQVAHSSFSQSNVDQLAQSAMDNIIGDLRQEITNGSGSPSPTASPVALFVPTSNANMLPMRNPTPTPGTTPAIPNLIRRSVRSEASLWPDPVNGPAVGSRASGVNSTNPADASANGRSISLARWNSHYLVPKLNTTDAGSDPITTGFNAPNYWAPDWVFVTAAGATPSPAPANVIGRYAYAVYDEGGLLDANLVGLPSPSPGPVSTPFSIPYSPTPSPGPSVTYYTGRKGTVAFADLTALRLTPGGSTPNPTTVSEIVGWRNYATASVQTNATFPNLAPSPSPFVTYFLNNSRDFLTVDPTVNSKGRTDQTFSTRSQLIQLVVSGLGPAAVPNLLQYLGTFSRELNSPTWHSASNPIPQRFQLDKTSLFLPT